jgi:hypothetical protein
MIASKFILNLTIEPGGGVSRLLLDRFLYILLTLKNTLCPYFRKNILINTKRIRHPFNLIFFFNLTSAVLALSRTSTACEVLIP